MEELVTNLKSPAWWFSVFFMAVLASLIAGFLRDWIPSYLSNYNKKIKRRNYRRKKNLARTIRAFVLCNEYYQSSAFQLQRETIFLFAMAAMSMVIAPMHKFYHDNPVYDPLSQYAPEFSEGIAGMLALALLFVLVPRLFLLNRKLLLLSYSHKRFRRKAMWAGRANKKN